MVKCVICLEVVQAHEASGFGVRALLAPRRWRHLWYAILGYFGVVRTFSWNSLVSPSSYSKWRLAWVWKSIFLGLKSFAWYSMFSRYFAPNIFDRAEYFLNLHDSNTLQVHQASQVSSQQEIHAGLCTKWVLKLLQNFSISRDQRM